MPVVRLWTTALALTGAITLLALVRVAVAGDPVTAGGLGLIEAFAVLWLLTFVGLLGVEHIRSTVTGGRSADPRRFRQVDLRLLIGLLTAAAVAVPLVADHLSTGLDGWHTVLLVCLGGGLGLFAAGVVELTHSRWH